MVCALIKTDEFTAKLGAGGDNCICKFAIPLEPPLPQLVSNPTAIRPETNRSTTTDFFIAAPLEFD